MADEEQLRLVKQGARAWNEWRKQAPDTFIDLHEASLSARAAHGGRARARGGCGNTVRHVDDRDITGLSCRTGVERRRTTSPRSGAGKSHLGAAIGRALVETGYRVLFMRTTDLVQRLQQARQALQLEAAVGKLDKYDLLVLDDLSYVHKDQRAPSASATVLR